jgi:HK97 family phage portal protein
LFDYLKNLLSPPETKASRTARLIAFESGGRARWTPRDYAALSREGYGKNAIVFRAVRLLAESIGGLAFLLYEGDAERSEHPLLDLLARPNPRQDGAGFLEAVTAHLLLAGNAYLEAVTLDANVRELYALRPDRMRLVPGPDGWPEAYEYTIGARSVRFEQSGQNVPPILHLSLFNPLDDHYGLAPLEAAAIAVDTHNAAAKWNKALLDNAARPSGALVYGGPDGQVLSDPQFERLKVELSDHYAGASNAGRPLVLEGGLDWKPMSLTPKDMDFMEAKHAAAARSRWPSACRRCCWRSPATTRIRITRKPIGCSGGKACCRSATGSAARWRNGWRRRSATSCGWRSTPIASRRCRRIAPRCGIASLARHS